MSSEQVEELISIYEEAVRRQMEVGANKIPGEAAGVSAVQERSKGVSPDPPGLRHSDGASDGGGAGAPLADGGGDEIPGAPRLEPELGSLKLPEEAASAEHTRVLFGDAWEEDAAPQPPPCEETTAGLAPGAASAAHGPDGQRPRGPVEPPPGPPPSWRPPPADTAEDGPPPGLGCQAQTPEAPPAATKRREQPSAAGAPSGPPRVPAAPQAPAGPAPPAPPSPRPAAPGPGPGPAAPAPRKGWAPPSQAPPVLPAPETPQEISGEEPSPAPGASPGIAALPAGGLAGASLEAWFRKRIHQLRVSTGIASMELLAVFQGLSDTQLAPPFDELKMWIGLDDQEPLPAALATLVAEFRVARAAAEPATTAGTGNV